MSTPPDLPLLTRRGFLAASALSAAALATKAEATPRRPLETIDLFRAGEGGYGHFRIPGLVATPGGALLAYCEARQETRGDWGDIDIVARRSTDGGRTWDLPLTLVDIREPVVNPIAEAQDISGSRTANNPVAIADRVTGAVHFLYCAAYARCYYMRSDDDGRSFSPPVDITAVLQGFRSRYPWGVVATGPGHGIQLRNGRLIVPVWMATGEGGNPHRPSALTTLYSDDHGATWLHGEMVAEHGALYPTEAGGRRSVATILNPSEAVAVELSDGRVMLNIRSESPEGRRAVAISPDGATRWSPPSFDPALYEPVCMGSIASLSPAASGEARLVFSNPDSRHIPRKYGVVSGARERLTIRLSRDDGASWPVARVLDPGASGYSDLAVGADGTIYCFYERGRAEVKGSSAIAFLTLARFDLSWVTG